MNRNTSVCLVSLRVDIHMSDAGNKEILQELQALRRRVTELEDVNELRKLQWKYGYYLDKCIVCPLFADSRFVQASARSVLYERRADGRVPRGNIQGHGRREEALH